MCAVNPAMGWINTGISNWLDGMGNTSKVLLGIIVAGMMSVDMGGPVNKAAYVFGTASLATGNFDVMAAVMIGGMVPPIAIALSTTFFKNKWNDEERRNGVVNYIMGLCFMCSRFSSGRRTFNGIWMYIEGTSWWCICISGCWQLAYVYICTCSRKYSWSINSFSIKEKSKVKIKA